MFLVNRHTKIYCAIIDRAKRRQLVGYFERHHIIPKSLGGSNDKSNIAELTAREHFICHRLLTRMTTGKARQKMVFASWRLASAKRYGTSRTYQLLREQMFMELRALPRTPSWRAKIGAAHRGKTVSDLTRKKLSAARKRSEGKTRTDDSYNKMSAMLQKKSPWNRTYIVTTPTTIFKINSLWEMLQHGMQMGSAKLLAKHGLPSRRGQFKGWSIQEC